MPDRCSNITRSPQPATTSNHTIRKIITALLTQCICSHRVMRRMLARHRHPVNKNWVSAGGTVWNLTSNLALLFYLIHFYESLSHNLSLLVCVCVCVPNCTTTLHQPPKWCCDSVLYLDEMFVHPFHERFLLHPVSLIWKRKDQERKKGEFII